jgi:hypothetical protein
MDGKLTKMKIVGYSDANYTQNIGFFDVLFNPTNITSKREQQFSTSNSTNGSSAQTVTYKGVGPSNFDVVLFFDGTGIISKEPVKDQIKKLQELAYDFNGDIHEPNYLRVYWGTEFLFEGRLSSWDVNHILLNLDGSPIRSELSISLVASVSAKKKALEERKNSSDLTHIRFVKPGDTLPLMCHRIYGDSSYYIKVARENKLVDFRNLKPGDQISFPPVI